MDTHEDRLRYLIELSKQKRAKDTTGYASDYDDDDDDHDSTKTPCFFETCEHPRKGVDRATGELCCNDCGLVIKPLFVHEAVSFNDIDHYHERRRPAEDYSTDEQMSEDERIPKPN